MEITSDGKAFVFCVFAGDGCECDTLVAIYSAEADASEHARSIESDPDMVGAFGLYGTHGHTFVQRTEVRGQVISAVGNQR